MRLEYFQLIDRIADLNLSDRTIKVVATVPTESTIFEGHFPGHPLMPGVLLGEAPLDEIAKSRGADPNMLRNLFSGDLQNLALTYDQVSATPMPHQTALAELLMATVNRKRKWS